MRTLDLAAGDDRALADDAVQRLAAAGGRAPLGEDELRRRQVGLIGADRPAMVVQVQLRIDRHQVHVGLVVGVQRAHVPPVGVLLAVLVEERVGEDAMGLDHRRDHVAAEVVLAAVPRGVQAELLEEEAGGKDVNPHRGQGMVRVAGHRLGLLRLLLEAEHAVLRVDLHDAELLRPRGDRPAGCRWSRRPRSRCGARPASCSPSCRCGRRPG